MESTNSWKSPEEIEYESKLIELKLLKNEVNELKEKWATLNNEVDDFCNKNNEELLSNFNTGEIFVPSDDLKLLYFSFIKTVCPDMVINNENYMSFYNIFTKANEAFRNGDIKGLQEITQIWNESPESVKGDNVTSKISRVIRKIALIKKQKTNLNIEIANILSSQLVLKTDQKLEETKNFIEKQNGINKQVLEEQMNQDKLGVIIDKKKLPTTIINPIDGAESVLVPAGEFLMGSSDEDEFAIDNEKPQHKVYLDDYYIYKTPVTVAQYRMFCEATSRWFNWSNCESDMYPIVDVSWDDAVAYTQWACVNLPTEAQWEKAARGTDGRIYPWGNDWDSDLCIHGEYNDINSDDQLYSYYQILGNVGSIVAGASPYDCLDMVGNVWEWCIDWYNEEYYQTSPYENPTGPISGEYRILRGGQFYEWSDEYLLDEDIDEDGNCVIDGFTVFIGDGTISDYFPDEDESICRSAYRRFKISDYDNNYCGFRCVIRLSNELVNNMPNNTYNTSIPIVKTDEQKVHEVINIVNDNQIMPTSSIKTNLKDGAEMILIPSGTFIMGINEEKTINFIKKDFMVIQNEQFYHIDYDKIYKRIVSLEHEVKLSSYYIYKNPVTVEQYRLFCKATKHPMPKAPSWGWHDTHPIVNVDWYEANKYANWAGMVLPSEAQWEKAARGIDGRVYPWGNDWNKNFLHCSIYSIGDVGCTSAVASKYLDGASPYGVLDMAGNVSEWCSDWYEQDYYRKSPYINPTGPEKGLYKVIRGCGWTTDLNNFFEACCSYRKYSEPDGIGYVSNSKEIKKIIQNLKYSRGFRCATPIK